MRNSEPAALDRVRLARVLGMLGSDHSGERDNAARLAHTMVREAGLRWDQVVVPALPEPEAAPPDYEWELFTRWPVRWQSAVCLAGRYLYDLPLRDQQFILSISGYTRCPSLKQLAWLRGICERLLAKGCKP
jgi:hypothetical protein